MTPIGKPGRDYLFTITVNDSAGTPQNVDDLDGLALYASTDKEGIIAQWSRDTVEGYLPMEVLNQTTHKGKVKILLAASKTKDLNDVTVFIEPVSQVEIIDYGKLRLSSKDGKSFELITLTATQKIKVPDLNP